MSGVASLYNVPSNDDELKAWSSIHMRHHVDINTGLYRLLKIALPLYLLDPIDVDNTGDWENNHQQMHDSQNALLSVAGYDLTGLNWKDQNLLSGWIFLNALDHRQAADILGIG
jgi:hypothetical protein